MRILKKRKLTLAEVYQGDLSTIIRLLHDRIPLKYHQERILEKFPMTDEGIENLIQIIHFINIAREKDL